MQNTDSSYVTVTFLNTDGRGAESCVTCKKGNLIPFDEIMTVPPDEEHSFQCWTEDPQGRFPCDPTNSIAEKDVTVYGHWVDGTAPYAASVGQIEERDGGIYHLPKGKTIFYGASNFTRWTTLEQDMAPEIDALNHGIGGATDRALLCHLTRLVLRYEPNTVVIQCSNNDVSKYSDGECMQTKEELYDRIHEALPGTKIIFVSHMPLPSKTKFWKDSQRLQQLNVRMREFCEKRENCEYLEAFDAILKIADAYLSGDTDAYFTDGSHFNAAGQAEFLALLKPEILRISEHKIRTK